MKAFTSGYTTRAAVLGRPEPQERMRRLHQATHTQVGHCSTRFVWMSRYQRLLVMGAYTTYWVLVIFCNSTVGLDVQVALTVFMLVRLLPIVFYRPQFGWFHPLVFTTYWAMADLIRSFQLYSCGISYHPALPNHTPEMLNGLVCFELILMSIGTLFYYIGFNAITSFPLPRVSLSRYQGFNKKLALMVCFSLFAFVLLMQSRGGVASHVNSWAQGRSVELSGTLVFMALPVIQLGTSASLLFLSAQPAAIRSPFFLVCSAISLGCVFLTTGSRSSVLYLMFVGFIVWMIRKQVVSYIKLGFLVSFVFLALVVLGNFRRSTWEGGADWSILTNFEFLTEDPSKLTDELVERSVAIRVSLPILQKVPEQVGYLRGESYLALIALPVPRILWSDKPKQIGGMVGRVFYHGNWGMPPGAIGESYWNYGIAGVCITFFCFGMFHRWLSQVFLRYYGEFSVVVAYAMAIFLMPSPTTYSTVDLVFALAPLMVARIVYLSWSAHPRIVRRPYRVT